jgi:membrane associated rhomboid family serine protease
MPPRYTSEYGLPPFTGAVRQIILACVAVYVVILLLLSFASGVGQTILQFGMLDAEAVQRGWIWQFFTYPFMSDDPWRFVVSLIGIYFLGPAVEARIGSRRFYGLFFGSTIVSGIIGFLLSFAGIARGPAFTVAAATNAIFMVFYLLNPDAPILAFFVLQVPIKWLLYLFMAIEVAYLLLTRFSMFFCVAVAGFGAGYLWYALFLTRPKTAQASEWYYGLRNSYYRWKRRRAARKFEVYMRQHNREVIFDEHGNYVPPEEAERKKNGGSKSGWVN